MIRCETTLDVPRPVSEVFAFVDDVGKAPQWLRQCVEIRQTSPPPKRVGTTLLYRYKEPGRTGQMDGVVTEYEKDARLVMKYTDKMFDLVVGFGFEPSAGGTKLHLTCEIAPKSLLAKLTSPMIRSATQKQMQRDTAKLVELLG